MNGLFSGRAWVGFVLVMTLGCNARGPLAPDTRSDGSSSAETRTSSIGGTVTLAGAPLNHARILLQGAGVSTMTLSGTDGSFVFTRLEPGSYSLTISTSLGLSCDSPSVEARAEELVRADIACVDLRGTITGTVTAGGAPLSGITVETSPVRQVATTDDRGSYRVLVQPGDYTVSASPEGTICEPASASVESNQTISVDIVCRPTGRIRVGAATDAGLIPADVTADGPDRRTVRVHWGNEVKIDALPPGDYLLTATTDFGTCRPATATVEVGRVAEVQVSCDLQIGAGDLQGQWVWDLSFYGQRGQSCDRLSDGSDLGSVAYDPDTGAVSLVGIDPEVTIAGHFQGLDSAGPGNLDGSGMVILPDGSSVRSGLTGELHLLISPEGDTSSPLGVAYFYLGATLTREHRDPGGDLVCTEIYDVEGYTLEPLQ